MQKRIRKIEANNKSLKTERKGWNTEKNYDHQSLEQRKTTLGAKEHAKTQALVIVEIKENQTRHKRGRTDAIYWGPIGSWTKGVMSRGLPVQR